ncbi:transposase [Halococcus salsus]|uniref:transposase n=1 Tax=Halococcus salsus TaxID=2162894 RepID=UPI003B8329B9
MSVVQCLSTGPHEFLSEEYQARKEERAGATLHLLHNATDQTIERLDVSDEKTHDSTLFNTGSWLQGRLVLLDLAYFKYRCFALIDENDGYFVSRLKKSAKPVITAELRGWRGRAIPLEASRSTTSWTISIVSTSTSRLKRNSSEGRTMELGRWIRSGSASSVSATRTPTTTICTSRICPERSSCRLILQRCTGVGGKWSCCSGS